MTTETKVSLSGAAALVLGAFAPVVSIPLVGSMNLFANGKGDGVILLPLAVLVAALAHWRKHVAGLVVGGIVVLFVGFKYVAVVDLVEVDESNPFLAGAQMQWGWLLLVAGAVLAVAGPIAASRKARREEVPKAAPIKAL